MSKLPPELEKKLTEAGMKPPAIEHDATEAFEANVLHETTFDDWIKKKREQHPHCFFGNEQIDLEAAAFAGGNITARSSLVLQLGEAEADERAVAWGLKGIRDFKTKGTRPFGNEAPPKDHGNNPFSTAKWNLTEQMKLYRADPKLAERLARAVGTTIGGPKPKAA